MSIFSYNYKDVPTIKRFALSNARHRVIVGPFGCLPGDTEYLTPKGWKRLDNYKDHDLVGQWDPQTGFVEFVYPERYVKIPATEWVNISSKTRFSLTMSDDHFMPVDVLLKTTWNRKIMRADEMGRLKGQHKLISTFLVEDRLYPFSENLIRYAVAVNADGTPPKDSPKAVEFGIHKTGKRERLISLLNALGLDYHERVYDMDKSVSGKYYSIRVINSPYREKTFDSPFWWKMRGSELGVVIDELTRWDGCIKGSASTLKAFSTTRESDVGFLQYAAAASGFRSTVGVEPAKIEGKHSPLYVMHFISPDSVKFPIALRKRYYTSKTIRASEGEFKYCFTMPKSFFVIRQNNTVLISSNSGKSAGCVVELVRRGHEQAPSPIDNIRKSRWAVIRNCYDDQTEILTDKRGWQLFKNLLQDDKVATLDGDDLVFKKPDGVTKAPYKGEMIGFEGEGANFLVTPDHKMYVSKRQTRKKVWGDFEVSTAQEIYGNQLIRVRRDAIWKGGHTEHSRDMFEFLGFWFAEGYVGKYPRKDTIIGYHYRFIVTQTENGEYVSGLLDRCGFNYGKNKNGTTFNYNIYLTDEVKNLIDKLITSGKATTKSIPAWIKDAPAGHLRAFLKGYEKGDGHTKNRKQDSTRLYTSSRQMADDLQEIIFKSGGVANLAIYKTCVCPNTSFTPTTKEHYVLTILQKLKHRPILHVNKKTTSKLKGWYKAPYDGLVYCVEMPLVPVYVRRSGKAFWCYRTYAQLRDTTMKTVFDWFPPEKYGIHKVADHEFIITQFDGVKIEIFFRALDRPDQVANLLSLELTGAWINEAREVPRQIWEALDGRIGRYPNKRDGGASWYGIIMDTNPPDETNWIYKLVEEEKPHNLALFRQPGGRSKEAENIPNLPQNYYEDLAIGKTQEFIRSYIDGEYGYVMSGEPVYKTSFNDSLHVAKRIIEPIRGTPTMLIPLISGWDFYLYPALAFGQFTQRGRLLILDEIGGRGMGAERFVTTLVDPLLNTAYRGMQIMGFGDPTGNVRAQSNESTCYQILKENNYHWIKPAYTNAEVPRIGAVEHFLTQMVDGEPAFQLSPKCQMLRKGFNGGYRRKDNGEIDKNEYSHCFAAGTMIETELGEKPIETIKPGERVLTPFGFQKVLKSWKTRNKTEVLEVYLSNGNKIVCTPDHKLFLHLNRVHANVNLVCAESLRYGTILESISISGVIKWNVKRLLNSMGLSSDFMKTGITEGTIRGEKQGFTEQYGNIITGTFQKAIISTTKTVIDLITPLKTLSLFRGVSTVPDIEGDYYETIERSLWRSLNLLKKAFVLPHAKAQRERNRGLTTLKENARSAVRFLSRINTLKSKHAVRVVGVRPLANSTDVYNITVENFHCYYTNQVLTANCHDALQYLCLFALWKYKRVQNVKAKEAAKKVYHVASSAGY